MTEYEEIIKHKSEKSLRKESGDNIDFHMVGSEHTKMRYSINFLSSKKFKEAV